MTLPKNFYQKLKPSHLPFPLSKGERTDGIYADLDDDGYITALHLYKFGSRVHALILDQDSLQGESQAIQVFYYDQGLAFIDGWKNFDGSSDTHLDTQVDTLSDKDFAKYARYINYVAWVREEVNGLAALQTRKMAINACSFCGKDQSEVKKLVAGPNVTICDECVDLTHEIIHTQ